MVMVTLGHVWRHYLRPIKACERRKPAVRIARELVTYWRHYRLPPKQYFLLGLCDTRTRDDVTAYLPRRIVYAWQASCNDHPEIDLLRDKRAFRRLMEANGLPCVRELFTIDAEGILRDDDGSVLDAGDAGARVAAAGGKVFVKPIDDHGGLGCALFDIAAGGLDPLRVPGQVRLVQPVIVQHPDIARLYPGSVNTLRIETHRAADGSIRTSCAGLRIGSSGRVVDNISRGGLAVPVDIGTGRLGRYARRMPLYGMRFHENHPDTDVPFAATIVPGWKDMLALVERAARLFQPLGAIGWDLVATPDGPVILEANANWGEDLFQLGQPLRDTDLGRTILDWHRGLSRPGPPGIEPPTPLPA
jgi:hypothetical protein